MAAIVKLADDEAFRTAFLHHYNLLLHPPVLANRNAITSYDPGGIIWVDP